MRSVPTTPAFLKTLGAELKRSTLTPAQADQIRRAAQVLEGGSGITADQIDKVGRELSLSTGQRAALRFAFLLERVQSSLGRGWQEAAHGTADALRIIAKQAEKQPKVAAAIDGFLASLYGADTGIALPPKPGALAPEGALQWLTAGPPPGPGYAEVSLVARGGKLGVSFAGKDGLVVDAAAGRGTRRVALAQLDDRALEGLYTALTALKPKSPAERSFVSRARNAVEAQQLTIRQTPYHLVATRTAVPAFDGVRLRAPAVQKIKPHGGDAGAFAKGTDGAWQFRVAKNGVLGEPVALDRLQLTSLLSVKEAIQRHHTSADALALADGELDPAAVEIDGALAFAIVQRQQSDRSAAAAAEDRLRRALKGLPTTNLDREVFRSLVGAVVPKRDP